MNNLDVGVHLDRRSFVRNGSLYLLGGSTSFTSADCESNDELTCPGK